MAAVSVRSGKISVADGVNLYYEMRSPANSSVPPKQREKLIMIMGAFATLKHFEEQAQAIVEAFANSPTPFDVLTYDHRGIGKSAPAPKAKQTTVMLACDALSLINQVWGETPVHIYGASLGGMVAQELAAKLAPAQRLKSLYLAVTSRGSFLRPMGLIGTSVWSAMMPMLIKSDKEHMIRNVLLPASFSPEALKDQGERYAQMWLADYDSWWAFGDRQACACQASAAAVHYLNSDKVAAILEAKPVITVQVATKDKLMAVDKQKEIVQLFKANEVIFDQGHMGDDSVKAEIFEASIKHLREAVSSDDERK